MRILFITTNAFIPEHFSGQNRTIMELCQKLTDLDHEAIVLSGKSTHEMQTQVQVDRKYGFKLFRTIDPTKSFSALCVTLRPDIVIVVDGQSEKLIQECQSLDVPLAVWLFNVEPHYYLNNSMVEKILFLASSPFISRRFTGLYGVKAHVLLPYINKELYSKPHSGKRILFVNTVRKKGIEIVFYLAQQRPDLKFTFVESGEVSEQWRALCFEKALRCGNIEWVMKTNDMDSVLDETRLLIVPRFNDEGFCRLVTEAQLGGIPVLASDRGYLPSNVGDGGTIIKIDSDLFDWLEPLDHYFEDETYYHQMSQKALLHANRDELEGNHIIEQLLTLLSAQITQHHNKLHQWKK
ncbi:MAG: glycosyltransferase family 4 protein [Gammaproteobacteria bacterium]|nr:glycosyltransferase family 4 protein [Gammaproteobacteria bacterium]